MDVDVSERRHIKQLLWQYLAIGGDHREVGSKLFHYFERCPVPELCRLENGNTVLFGDDFRCRGHDYLFSAHGLIRLRENSHDVPARIHKPLEDGGGKIRRPHKDYSHILHQSVSS